MNKIKIINLYPTQQIVEVVLVTGEVIYPKVTNLEYRMLNYISYIQNDDVIEKDLNAKTLDILAKTKRVKHTLPSLISILNKKLGDRIIINTGLYSYRSFIKINIKSLSEIIPIDLLK